MGNELKSLREAKGWTHEAAADAMGVSRGQFIKLERGERRMNADYIARAARAFGVTPAAVLGAQSSIPVVGLVGAGGAISTEHENHSEPLFEVDLPFSVGDAVGYLVRGDSMWPRYDDGDVIVVSAAHDMPDQHLGLEVVVKVGDPDGPGDRFFKRLIRGADSKTFDLESYNAPPMRGLHIGWVSTLIARVPAAHWRKRNAAPAKRPTAGRRPKAEK